MKTRVLCQRPLSSSMRICCKSAASAPQEDYQDGHASTKINAYASLRLRSSLMQCKIPLEPSNALLYIQRMRRHCAARHRPPNMSFKNPRHSMSNSMGLNMNSFHQFLATNMLTSSMNRDNIYNTCPRCQNFPGLIQIRPQRVTWHYTDEKEKYSSSVDRVQLPILPEQACPLYGLQGTTANPGLWAHWHMPARMDQELKWLLVYVMLSRVRSLDCLVSSCLNDKIRPIIESGPPQVLVGNFHKLFGEKIKATRRAARDAREKLGWPLPTGN